MAHSSATYFAPLPALYDPPRLYSLLRLSAEPPSSVLVEHSLPLAQKRNRKTEFRRMTSSERGVKFRQRQQKRELTLAVNNEKLKHEIQRLEITRNLYTEKTLLTTELPMKFIMGYFEQFRIGLRVPGGPKTQLSSEKQRNFLNLWIEPHTKLANKPAIELILSVWEHYSKMYTSVNLEFESAELIPADQDSSVVVRGILHLRCSRETIARVYPGAIAEEDLIQKLIGRQLHVRYRAQMHFNKSGRLVGYEVAPDFVGAMMEILGNVRDCDRILGGTLIKGLVLGEKAEGADNPRSAVHPMDIDFICSN